MYSFPDFEPVCCSMSSSNCCFLTCIQISQEAGQVVWYSYCFQNFPQFVVIHTVKGFGIVNKAEVISSQQIISKKSNIKKVTSWILCLSLSFTLREDSYYIMKQACGEALRSELGNSF